MRWRRIRCSTSRAPAIRGCSRRREMQSRVEVRAGVAQQPGLGTSCRTGCVVRRCHKHAVDRTRPVGDNLAYSGHRLIDTDNTA